MSAGSRRIRTSPVLLISLSMIGVDYFKWVKKSVPLFVANLALIITCSAVSALRDYTVVVLIAYFLIFGPVAGLISARNARAVFKSFWNGIVGALPTIVFIALASSIKYIFDEGAIMPTIVHSINTLVAGHSPFVVALVLYAIILVLEFFISSSTAKAILVMGMLAVVSVPLSKQMLVLIYTFADGYTNVLFPTSPVLLIYLAGAADLAFDDRRRLLQVGEKECAAVCRKPCAGDPVPRFGHRIRVLI